MGQNPSARDVELARRLIANPRAVRGNFAPDFAGTTLDGPYVTSDELRGKLVLLQCWASTSPTSGADIDLLRSLKERFEKDGLLVIGITSNLDKQVLQDFVKRKRMHWPQVLDNGKIREAFHVNGFPTCSPTAVLAATARTATA